MADYSYKSFLDDEDKGNTFSYDHEDTNSSAWDSLNTPSNSQQTNTQPTSPAYTPVASPTVKPQTDDPADKTRADLIQARRDIVNAPNQAQNTDSADKYTSKLTGFTYDKPKESHANDAYLGVMGFLAGYLRNFDDAEGMDGAYAAVSDNQNKVDRFKNIDYYEQKGYNPVDINSYFKTGKEDDMIKNKTQWQSAGGGYIFNPDTGTFKSGTGVSANKQVDKTVDLGGSIEVHYKDGTVETKPKTMTPEQGQNVRTVDLGDRIETYEANNNLISSQPKGVSPGTANNGKGGVGVQQNKLNQANEQANKQLDITKGRVSTITDKIANADRSAFSPMFGQLPGYQDLTGDASLDSLNKPSMISNVAAMAGDKLGLTKGSQDLYAAYAELDGLATQTAISHAKASGASGINTEAEAKRFRAGAPTVDFSRDPETIRHQMLDLAKWVNDNNESQRPISTAGSAPSQGGSSAPAGSGQFTTSSGVSYTVSKG